VNPLIQLHLQFTVSSNPLFKHMRGHGAKVGKAVVGTIAQLIPFLRLENFNRIY
jgi:hypothetical protein